MSPLARILLTLEVIICFAPVLLMLLLGALLLPIQAAAIADQPLIWQGPVTVIGSVVCGIIGLVTLMLVLRNRFRGRNSTEKSVWICIGVALGALPILPIVLFGNSFGWRLVGAMPLVASAHVLFLARQMVFPSWRDAIRGVSIATAVALLLVLPLIFNPFGTTRKTLQDQKALWEQARPTRYEFTVQLSGSFEPDALHPKRVVVENGQVISAQYVWDFNDHRAGDPAPLHNVWTIDRTFVELLSAQEQGWSISARFDERWGFVEQVYVDADTWESGWNGEIRDFRALSE